MPPAKRSTAVQIEDIAKDVSAIRQMIEGTERQEGLIQKVEKNTVFIIQQKTKNKIVNGLLGSGWLVTIFIALTQIGK